MKKQYHQSFKKGIIVEQFIVAIILVFVLVGAVIYAIADKNKLSMSPTETSSNNQSYSIVPNSPPISSRLSLLPEILFNVVNADRDRQKYARLSPDIELEKVSVEWNQYVHINHKVARISTPNESYRGSAYIIQNPSIDSNSVVSKWINDPRSNKRLCYPWLSHAGLVAVFYDDCIVCTMIIRTNELQLTDRYYWWLFPVYYELTSGEIN